MSTPDILFKMIKRIIEGPKLTGVLGFLKTMARTTDYTKNNDAWIEGGAVDSIDLLQNENKVPYDNQIIFTSAQKGEIKEIVDDVLNTEIAMYKSDYGSMPEDIIKYRFQEDIIGSIIIKDLLKRSKAHMSLEQYNQLLSMAAKKEYERIETVLRKNYDTEQRLTSVVASNPTATVIGGRRSRKTKKSRKARKARKAKKTRKARKANNKRQTHRK